MSADREKVISFPGGGDAPLPDNPLVAEDGYRGFCQHDSVLVDKHLRTVTCNGCGAVLDAFDFLLNNAATIQRAWANYREVNRRIAEKLESVKALQATEKRLRAVVARLKDKADGVTLNPRG